MNRRTFHFHVSRKYTSLSVIITSNRTQEVNRIPTQHFRQLINESLAWTSEPNSDNETTWSGTMNKNILYLGAFLLLHASRLHSNAAVRHIRHVPRDTTSLSSVINKYAKREISFNVWSNWSVRCFLSRLCVRVSYAASKVRKVNQ